jgi:dephospho-CoA kinase
VRTPVHRVGLTGNIAAGKSVVARVWESLGAPVVDADVLARQAVAPGSPGLAKVRREWGDAVLTPEGALDRAALREIVFRDPDARRRLEAIVHPRVAELRDEAYARLEAEGAPVVVADIPLLFEVGMEDDFDTLVLVDAPEPVRMRRLVEHRGIDPQEARRLVEAQMPAERKRARADWVIDNTGTLAALEEAAREAWRWIESRAGIGGGNGTGEGMG